ncbi:MAG: TIGR04063 family PEP-CTERM/XrtA system glycosyltransferase [Planctomycetota bacterium]
MKILHVLDHSIPLHSGYTFRTRSILEQQRALGWQTEHLTSSKHTAPSEAVEEVDGLRFFRTAAGGGPASRLPVLNQVAVIRDLKRRLAEVARETAPDLIHAHSPALNGVAAVGVGRDAGLPVVYEVRAFWEDAAVDLGTSRPGGLRYRLTRAMETWVLRRAAAVTTICEGLRHDIVRRGIPEEKVTVIPNAVDVSRFRLLAERDAALEAELGLAGKRVLGFIGSFYSYEGLALLVDAMPAMLREAPGIRLLLVGGGNEAERLRRQAGELGVADAVAFTGRVPHDQVERYYTLCDAMVYPRLSIRLTELVTPLKPLEAMAQGKIVVASDVGGHRELIRPGETGVLFRAGDKESLAAAVLELVAHEERWPALRAAGRRFVEQERSWAASVMRYAPVYEGLLQGPV